MKVDEESDFIGQSGKKKAAIAGAFAMVQSMAASSEGKTPTSKRKISLSGSKRKMSGDGDNLIEKIKRVSNDSDQIIENEKIKKVSGDGDNLIENEKIKRVPHKQGGSSSTKVFQDSMIPQEKMVLYEEKNVIDKISKKTVISNVPPPVSVPKKAEMSSAVPPPVSVPKKAEMNNAVPPPVLVPSPSVLHQPPTAVRGTLI